MATVSPPSDSGHPPGCQEPARLPVRWVVIAMLAVAAGTAGFMAGGVVPAITVGCAVATAAHKLIH